MNLIKVIFHLFLYLMFPIIARTFSYHAASRSPALLMSSRVVGVVPRFMTTGNDQSSTTIVDICKQKIQAALNTEDVKVTGK